MDLEELLNKTKDEPVDGEITQDLDLSSLVYKTMPRGYPVPKRAPGADIPVPPSKPQTAPANQPVTITPKSSNPVNAQPVQNLKPQNVKPVEPVVSVQNAQAMPNLAPVQRSSVQPNLQNKNIPGPAALNNNAVSESAAVSAPLAHAAGESQLHESLFKSSPPSITPQVQRRSIGAKRLLAILAVLILLMGGYVFAKYHKHGSKGNVADNGQGLTGNGGDSSQSSVPGSQIPDWWRTKYFGNVLCPDQSVCGDNADPDHDGLTNYEEYKLGTDPNNPDSSGSGIADGDKVHVFNLDPLSNHTAGIPNYTDAGDLKYHYNSHQHKALSDTDLKQIAANIKQYGLHSPTTKTLDGTTINFYTNYGQAQAAAGNPKPGALDRDTQRLDAIKQISFALLKYYDANQAFPNTTDFNTMISDIKPLLSGRAVNTTDPTNIAPYVYTYTPVNDPKTGTTTDFNLTYFSETQNQVVTTNQAEARKNLGLDQENQRDTKRQSDIEQIAAALTLYSNDNANPNNPTQKVFPSQATWKQAISPKYMTIIPVDPQTNMDYAYTVSADNGSFAVQAMLENPPTGKKGYVCTQDGCGLY